MKAHKESYDVSAYGGEGWSPRTETLDQEIGKIWGPCGINSEWARLRAVMLHRPGPELKASADPNAVQMIEPLDVARAQAQHDGMAAAYEEAGVIVHRLALQERPSPNQMFIADLVFMTPEGAILARPASTVRAGEERRVARCLAELGIPIVRSVRGGGTFEGADAAWIDSQTVILGRGLRTNDEGAAQVSSTLNEMGVDVVVVDLPFGSMHLMGMLRFADRDLALAWPLRLVHRAVDALKDRGYQVAFIPDPDEALACKAFNFVTLGPREILMASNNPVNQAFFEDLGVTCHTVPVDELGKAAGAIGCLTGVLEREPA